MRSVVRQMPTEPLAIIAGRMIKDRYLYELRELGRKRLFESRRAGKGEELEVETGS